MTKFIEITNHVLLNIASISFILLKDFPDRESGKYSIVFSRTANFRDDDFMLNYDSEYERNLAFIDLKHQVIGL